MDRSETNKTLAVLAFVFLIAYLVLDAKWLLWIAAFFCAGSAFENPVTSAIARYWLKFAAVLGHANSKILLTFMFFAVLTPIAFVYRHFNREKVDHFLADNRDSYFDDIKKTYGPEDFEKLW